MKKRIFSFLCLLLFAAFTPTFAQDAKVNPNADHDRMHALTTASYQVVLPAEVIEAVKAHARKEHINENAALRETYILQPIFNTSLSREDRLFACKIAYELFNLPGRSIPVKIITDAQHKIGQ